MAGYSGTPLPKKLGIKAGHRIALLRAPAGFRKTLGALPQGVDVKTTLRGKAVFDVIVYFSRSGADVAARFDTLRGRLDPAGGLWFAWPKKASGVSTDLTEDLIRELALRNGLVDNKVCAIDETWSGLRCVVRLKDRPPARGGALRA